MDQPRLKFLHAASTLNRVKVEGKLSTHDLKASLALDQPGCLKARIDGTVLDGHHRLSVVIERGENIDQPPREIIEKESE